MLEKKILPHLIAVCNQIAHGKYEEAAELFRMTRDDIGIPADMTTLAEAFGLMLVQLEAREYRLEQIIADLRISRDELSRRHEHLATENRLLRKSAKTTFSTKRILGSSPAIQALIGQAERIADTPVTILISGESGTGKELLAKSLHFTSHRADKPFVALNCSAIPETLFEAEMFGIEKGVATGVERRIGRLEQANGGTLFLDEVGDMPTATQAKILRVLEEREYERVGGRTPLTVDIRIIAATHRDLKQMVTEGAFREDLLYRLNVVNLRIPPLRERLDDIPLLAVHCLRVASLRMGRAGMQFSPQALCLLRCHDWPGNVRELENEIERAVALTIDNLIQPDDFSETVRKAADINPVSCSQVEYRCLTLSESDRMRLALAQAGGNKSETARQLGITREGLRKKLKKLGVT
jgi:transcriptional regulator with PAS, ATPase and Fis domain